MTQVQAAEHLYVDASTLGRYENGQTPYNQDLLERAADLYRCGIVDLLTRNPLSDYDESVDAIMDALRDASQDQRDQAAAVIRALVRKPS
jgi:transcriptional regulator with XRE-family HTH domain